MTSRLAWIAIITLAAPACVSTAVLEEENPVLVTAAPPPEPEPEPEPERVEVKEEKIQVNEKIHFEFDSAKIRSESDDLLAEIGQVINDHPELIKIRVEGHTDSKGSAEYNLDLSKRRANAVMKHLVEKNGVDAARLEIEGYGLEQPIATNDTDEGRAQNRRVEFTILERDQSLAKAEGAGEPAESTEGPAEDAEDPTEGGAGESAEEAEESAEGAEEPDESTEGPAEDAEDPTEGGAEEAEAGNEKSDDEGGQE